MASRPDVPDLAVDELRRRARRRLIGAIILALAAAVLLPLLLENEPKPLGDDVSIQIPPIDSGKFINPLSSGKAQDPKAKGSIAVGKNGTSVVAPPPADAPTMVPPATNPKSSEAEQPTSGTSIALPTPAIAPPAAAPESKAAGITQDSLFSGYLLSLMSEDRLQDVIGKLSDQDMRRLDDCLKAALGIP